MRHVFYRQTRLTSACGTRWLYAFKRVLRNAAGLHQYKKQLLATELLLPSHERCPCFNVCDFTLVLRNSPAAWRLSPRRTGKVGCGCEQAPMGCREGLGASLGAWKNT